MDQVTQQNAALVEESAAAAESLQDQAKQLVQVVSVFKTGQNATTAGVSSVRKVTASKPVVKAIVRPAKTAVAKPSAAPQLPAKLGGDKGDDWEEF